MDKDDRQEHVLFMEPFGDSPFPSFTSLYGTGDRDHGDATTITGDSIPRARFSSAGAQSFASARRTSSNASSTYFPAYDPSPAPTKPLPPIPCRARGPSTSIGRHPSVTTGASSVSGSLSPQYSDGPASFHAASFDLSSPKSPKTARFTISASNVWPRSRSSSEASPMELSLEKLFASEDKRVKRCVYYLDVSSTSSTLASKHGNNHIKVWSLDTGSVLSRIKFTSYTEAQSRSRNYLIRSHAILSETLSLMAISTKFGRTIEIWNWEQNKCLQTFDAADRWAACKMEGGDQAWARLALYKNDIGTIDLFAATRDKKPFGRMRTIHLAEAELPFLPQYPEIALSATSPLLIAAAGPRPPRPGHPAPERETLLVAWETHRNGGIVGSKPYRVAHPWQHQELQMALPCDLVTYGSIAVSIWLPAEYRAVPVTASRRRSSAFNLAPVRTPYRYVLVWDLSANSTRSFGIPNCTSCISADCRFAAYCHADGAAIGARGTLAVVDVMTGREVWCWPDRNATAMESGPKPGFQQFEDLAKVTELSFSADSTSLIVADSDGRLGIYNFRAKVER